MLKYYVILKDLMELDSIDLQIDLYLKYKDLDLVRKAAHDSIYVIDKLILNLTRKYIKAKRPKEIILEYASIMIDNSHYHNDLQTLTNQIIDDFFLLLRELIETETYNSYFSKPELDCNDRISYLSGLVYVKWNEFLSQFDGADVLAKFDKCFMLDDDTNVLSLKGVLDGLDFLSKKNGSTNIEDFKK